MQDWNGTGIAARGQRGTDMRKSHPFKFKSIRTSILVSFSVLIISSLLFFTVFSMNYTEDAVIENSQDYSMQLVRQVNTEIDTYINYMGNIAYTVTQSQDALTFLQQEDEGQEGSGSVQYGGYPLQEDWEQESLGRLKQQFTTILDSRPDISNIGILGENGRCLVNRGDEILNPYIEYRELDWYRDVIDETLLSAGGIRLTGIRALLSASHVQNVIRGSYPWVVTLSTPITDRQTGEPEGVFFVDLNYSSINSLGRNISLGSRGYVFIVDDEANIIFHPQQQLLYSGLKKEKIDEVLTGDSGSFVVKDGDNSRVYTFCRSAETGWTTVGVSYLNELMKNRDSMQNAYFLSALVLFTAAVLLTSLISREITKPIRYLQNSMRQVEKGNFAYAETAVDGENEIAQLGASFNRMTKRIQELMEQNVQEQREKRKSELNALQSQINPHFLYNTLDSIIWMAESGRTQEVVVMTSQLARLLRQSISNEDEIVTIESEISYTKSYLTIQKMRYQDQLEFEIDVDQEALSMPIVKLVIQPLVENAIYHGVKYAEHGGIVSVSVKVAREKLVITVADNGPGMSRETLAHIFEKRENGKSGKVGVYNVHHRLQLYYGPEYGLSYKSAPGAGTMAFITIPNPNWEETDDEAFRQ